MRLGRRAAIAAAANAGSQLGETEPESPEEFLSNLDLLLVADDVLQGSTPAVTHSFDPVESWIDRSSGKVLEAIGWRTPWFRHSKDQLIPYSFIESSESGFFESEADALTRADTGTIILGFHGRDHLRGLLLAYGVSAHSFQLFGYRNPDRLAVRQMRSSPSLAQEARSPDLSSVLDPDGFNTLEISSNGSSFTLRVNNGSAITSFTNVTGSGYTAINGGWMNSNPASGNKLGISTAVGHGGGVTKSHAWGFVVVLDAPLDSSEERAKFYEWVDFRYWNPRSHDYFFIEDVSLPFAKVGASYVAQLPTAGGAEPASFTLESGSLPDGLTLSSTGQVSGVPEEEGIFSLTVSATDSASVTSMSKTFTVFSEVEPVPRPEGLAALWFAEDVLYDVAPENSPGPPAEDGDYVKRWIDRGQGVILLDAYGYDTYYALGLYWDDESFGSPPKGSLHGPPVNNSYLLSTRLTPTSDEGSLLFLLKDEQGESGRSLVFDYMNEAGDNFACEIRLRDTYMDISLLTTVGEWPDSDNYGAKGEAPLSESGYYLIEVGSNGVEPYVMVNGVSVELSVPSGRSYLGGRWMGHVVSGYHILSLHKVIYLTAIMSTTTVVSPEYRQELFEWVSDKYGVSLAPPAVPESSFPLVPESTAAIWAADDILGDTSITTPSVNGDPIERWVGFPFALDAPGDDLAYSFDGVGGEPGVIGSVNEAGAGLLVSASDQGTCVVVAELADGLQTSFKVADQSGRSAGVSFDVSLSGSSYEISVFAGVGDSGFTPAYFRYLKADHTLPSATEVLVVEVDCDGTDLTFHINGEEPTTVTDVGLATFGAGYEYDGGWFANLGDPGSTSFHSVDGHCSLVILTDEVLSPTERSSLYAVLNTRYDLGLGLSELSTEFPVVPSPTVALWFADDVLNDSGITIPVSENDLIDRWVGYPVPLVGDNDLYYSFTGVGGESGVKGVTEGAVGAIVADQGLLMLVVDLSDTSFQDSLNISVGSILHQVSVSAWRNTSVDDWNVTMYLNIYDIMNPTPSGPILVALRSDFTLSGLLEVGVFEWDSNGSTATMRANGVPRTIQDVVNLYYSIPYAGQWVNDIGTPSATAIDFSHPVSLVLATDEVLSSLERSSLYAELNSRYSLSLPT